MNELSASIRDLRLAHEMTQAQLAARLGVQYQTVSKWETGTTVPDTMMLPRLADLFGTSIDALFGRTQISCSANIPEDAAAFLLDTYARMYGPEAGPWNLSVENRYLEYRFAAFFEQHFPITEQTNICNIGIGAGEWDRYLSYRLRGGSLTSIDRLELCCQQLRQRLCLEGNPNPVHILCADVMELTLSERFDIVTMVGSTLMEGEAGLRMLERAMELVRQDGAIYYQSLDGQEDCDAVIRTAHRYGMALDAMLEDEAYGFRCHYYKFRKISAV